MDVGGSAIYRNVKNASQKIGMRQSRRIWATMNFANIKILKIENKLKLYYTYESFWIRVR